MKSFKTLFIIGCVAIALVLGMIIGNSIHENTSDFVGTVSKISEKENGSEL